MKDFNAEAMTADFSQENETTAAQNGQMDMPYKKVNGRYYLNIDKETMEQALNRVYNDRIKREKIYKMSSLQRIRHQRQFAVLHFLLNGMEEFIGNMSMHPAQKRSIIVVYDVKTSQAADFLAGQMETMEKMGIAFDVDLCSSYKFEKLLKERQKLSENYIIYIGNFSESKKTCESIQHWRFDKFGFRYGWIGDIAVITFEREPTKDEFGQMMNVAETEFTKMKHQIDMTTKLEGNFWNELSTPQKIILGVGAAAVVAFFGAGTAAIVNNNKRKKDMDEFIKKRYGSPDSKYIPKDIKHTSLTKEQIKELKHKSKMEELTDEEWEYIHNSEYGEEWIGRDDELCDISLEDYDNMRCLEDYGLDDEDMDCGDEESVIRDDD